MTAHNSKTSLILTLGLALVAMPFAFAGHHEGKNPQEAMFKAMDSSGDGKISRAEHAAGAKKVFAEMDANKDGKVTAAEMTAAHAKMKEAMAATSKDSARTGTAATPAMPMKPAKTDAVVVTAAGVPTEKAMMHSDDIIKNSDTDHDGQLSAAEHAAASDAKFTKADTNKDNSLTLEECTAGGMLMH